MKRLYFSLLVWLGLPIVTLILSINYLLGVFLPEELALQQRIHHLVDLIDQAAQHQGEEYAVRLAHAVAAVHYYDLEPVAFIDPQVSEAVAAQFADGHHVVWENSKDSGYFTFGDRQTLYLAHPTSSIRWINWGLLGLIFMAVALACLKWLFLLRRRIRKLETTTNAFADGDFDARASTAGADRLGELNVRFNDMASKISTLLTSHKQLTNAVAHEMRTPLFRLRCQLELLSDSRQNAAQSKHIAGMQDDIDEMNDMTDELLHYARIERSGVSDDWHAVAPNAFMDYLLAKLDREPGNRSLTIEVSAHLPAMVINRVQMERAIGNVIRNALKYSDGRVHVTLAEQNGTFSCVVDDDGPGIPVEARERVFEPFARLDAARDRASGGHGLGLAIARQIIHGHQGSMHCEDSPLGGARFCISFPVLRET